MALTISRIHTDWRSPVVSMKGNRNNRTTNPQTMSLSWKIGKIAWSAA